MKSLLVTTAFVEVAAGVAIVVAPSTLAQLLLGAPLDGPAATSVSRIAGAALLALATACWSARGDIAGRAAAAGIVAAALLYNCGAVAVLVHAATVGLHGIAFWPAAGLHTALAIWCVACLTPHRNAISNPPTPKRE